MLFIPGSAWHFSTGVITVPDYTQRSRIVFVLIALSIIFISLPAAASAQKEDPQVLKIRAKELVDQLKMPEALPLYEKLVVELPSDPDVFFYYGLSLLGQAANITDEAAARQLRIKARNAFVTAQKLGNDTILLKGFIEGIPLDGSPGGGFSDNKEAERLMQQGEAAFTSGRLDDALTAYESALKADPLCYHAALFIGDVHTQKGNFSKALTSYKHAISIDPNKETAYRYSATPLMRQNKYDEARDLYIEAFVIEPYNKLAVSGIIQWAQATKTSLGHPKIDVPTITVGADGKTQSTLNLSSDPSDGSLAWATYASTRDEWRKVKFAKQFPGQAYRHSLAEEVDALRSVVSTATTMKPKNLNGQIALLAQMDKDGVLEAYVLMAIPDQGIAQDHRQFLIAHRDKLKLYVTKYVIQPGK